MYSCTFYPIITKPSRITNRSASLIDNIMTNSMTNPHSAGLLVTDISDHLPVFCITDFEFSKKQGETIGQRRCYRNFDKKNINEFKSLLSKENWESVYNNTDANACYCNFVKIFNTHFEKCFPLKTISTKKNLESNNKGWFTKGLRKSSNVKNKLYRKYLKNPTPTTLQKYKTYRNKFNGLIRTSKRQYYQDRFTTVSNDIRNTWKLINELLNRKKASATLPSKFMDGEDEITNQQNIVDKFNDFFVNIGPSLANKIDKTDHSPLSYLQNEYPAISLFDAPSTAEILDIILNLKNAAPGKDEIKASLLKQVASEIVEPITYVFKTSIETGKVPSDLKVAKVIPLYKSGNPCLFTNYRPISILPVFSKILEKVVYKRILKHLDDNNILYAHQYGFRKNYSTYMPLLQLIDKITSALENKEFTIGIFLDLSKAFDTVDHNILLGKLNSYGFKGSVLQWLKDYLSERTQYVSNNSFVSSQKFVTCGVPQGSILGPLLFLIYVNDLPMISEKFFALLFADDTNLFISHKNFDTLISTINDELCKLNQWFKSNKLSLNIDKTNFIIFTGRNKKYSKEMAKIYIENKPIKHVSNARFLGVVIDEKLTWKFHIDIICKKISKNIGIIRKVANCLSRKIFMTLYHSLIYPYLTYCNIIWASTYTTSIKPLHLLQKRFVRIASNASFIANSAALFHNLKILTVYDINKLQSAIFVHKVIHNSPSLPVLYKDIFKYNSDIHDHSTRQQNRLRPIKTKSNLTQFTILFRGPSIWNTLSLSNRNCQSLSVFKKSIKNNLIEKPTICS